MPRLPRRLKQDATTPMRRAVTTVLRAWVIFAAAVGVMALAWLEVTAGVDSTAATDRGVYDESSLWSIDYTGLPATTTITARDGTPLAVRVYVSQSRTVVLAIHGSSGNNRYFHPLAQSLAAHGKATVYALDLRGHGESGGRRGDVDYIGQLGDDLVDLAAAIRRDRPNARLIVLGHSAGGGLIVRSAGSGQGLAVDGYVLLAPFLGPQAPTTRPAAGGWAVADVPKIMELATKAAQGDTAGQDAIVLRFNQPPSPNTRYQVLANSFRMLMSYTPGPDLARDLAGIRRPLLVLAGDRDESFYPDRYEPTIAPYATGTFKMLPGVTHLGLVVNPQTGQEIEAWLGTLP
jgi:non-heme chloroperoxidase